MSEQSPDDIIDFSGAPRSLGEQRDHGFRIMKARMLEIKRKQWAHVSPIIRGAKLGAYEQGLNDAFNVFAQVVEMPSEEELSPG